MIKKIILFLLSLFILSYSKKRNDKVPLTHSAKKTLIIELKQMIDNDQRNRSYISYRTFNQKLIDSIKKLSTEEYISFMQSNTSDLTKKQEDSLWVIQHKIDLKNTNRLYELTKKYGWLSKTKLDSIVDPIILLLHTPEETIEKMQEILFKEVNAKRMTPIKFAMYVDNMRKKAFGKNQLYGTGNEFDPKTNTVLPPLIENIDSTNRERKKIGLPILKEGEYRIYTK